MCLFVYGASAYFSQIFSPTRDKNRIQSLEMCVCVCMLNVKVYFFAHNARFNRFHSCCCCCCFALCSSISPPNTPNILVYKKLWATVLFSCRSDSTANICNILHCSIHFAFGQFGSYSDNAYVYLCLTYSHIAPKPHTHTIRFNSHMHSLYRNCTLKLARIEIRSIDRAIRQCIVHI